MASKATVFSPSRSVLPKPACATIACAKLSLVFSTKSGLVVDAILDQASSSARFSTSTVWGQYGAASSSFRASIGSVHRVPARADANLVCSARIEARSKPNRHVPYPTKPGGLTVGWRGMPRVRQAGRRLAARSIRAARAKPRGSIWQAACGARIVLIVAP
jgi:hypothetical protein